jgi:hypothetical protein
VDVAIGEEIRRRTLHEEYGGRRQGGISPSLAAPVVMLFTDPSRGHQHGYYDGWDEDGLFNYTGEGQVGDQKMVQGNKTILNHIEDGRKLHLFAGVSSGVVSYVGEFELDDELPWHWSDELDTMGELRSVIMFRLKPISAVAPTEAPLLPRTPRSGPEVADVPIEVHNVERTVVNPNQEPHEAERREAALVVRYQNYLERLGHTVSRKRIVPSGDLKPLYTDLFDATSNVLVEAKGSVTREAIRMAIGQLLDYRRFISPTPTLAVLLPSRPRNDLIDLCTELSIRVIWEDGRRFDEAPT